MKQRENNGLLTFTHGQIYGKRIYRVTENREKDVNTYDGDNNGANDGDGG